MERESQELHIQIHDLPPRAVKLDREHLAQIFGGRKKGAGESCKLECECDDGLSCVSDGNSLTQQLVFSYFTWGAYHVYGGVRGRLACRPSRL